MSSNPVRAIIASTAQYFGMSVDDMLRPKCRIKRFVRARWIATLILRQTLGLELAAIGRLFADRHHSTISHGIAEAQALLASDPTFRRAYEAICVELNLTPSTYIAGPLRVVAELSDVTIAKLAAAINGGKQ